MTAITADFAGELFAANPPFARAFEALSSIVAQHGKARMVAWARGSEDEATKFVAVLLENTALAVNLMRDLEGARQAGHCDEGGKGSPAPRSGARQTLSSSRARPHCKVSPWAKQTSCAAVGLRQGQQEALMGEIVQLPRRLAVRRRSDPLASSSTRPRWRLMRWRGEASPSSRHRRCAR